jgi:hypothetical protein
VNEYDRYISFNLVDIVLLFLGNENIVGLRSVTKIPLDYAQFAQLCFQTHKDGDWRLEMEMKYIFETSMFSFISDFYNITKLQMKFKESQKITRITW